MSSTIPLLFTTVSFCISCSCMLDTLPLINKKFLKKPFFYMVFLLLVTQTLFFIADALQGELQELLHSSRIRLISILFYSATDSLTCFSIIERNKIFIRDERIRKITAIVTYVIFTLQVIANALFPIMAIAYGNFDSFYMAVSITPNIGIILALGGILSGLRTLVITVNEVYIVFALRGMGYIKDSHFVYAPRYIRLFMSIVFGIFVIVSIFLPSDIFRKVQSVKMLALAIEVYVLIDVFKFEVEAIKVKSSSNSKSGALNNSKGSSSDHGTKAPSKSFDKLAKT